MKSKEELAEAEMRLDNQIKILKQRIENHQVWVEKLETLKKEIQTIKA